MKTWKILLAVLLTVAIICVVAACAQPTVTVTFYNGSEVHETVQVTKGDKLTLPDAPKAEKDLGLAGWSTIDGDMEEIIDPATFVVNGDLELYAVWADVYTVVINADNGTPFTVQEVIIGTTIDKPEDPVKEGFRFVEWRDALNDASYDFSKPIYADLTIKAMYGDGAPNRVSDTKWDFSFGVHGSWIGAQGGWKYEVNGLPAEDMVYQTTEDGYAAWGFAVTDSLDNIPVVNGNNGEGLGMKYIYNEGISVEASKAKLVVAYLKPKYYPIDMATSPNDQFRISVLTSNGGMIYGYGNGSEAWSLRTDAASESLIQVDQMEDGWIRVQFKIHKLAVWSEDAMVKGMAISFVQRKATPVMDIISFKSIELLDQEEFIDPHESDYVTKIEWDMRNKKDATNWIGYHAKKKNEALTTTVTDAGMMVDYEKPGNGWKGIVLENALLDISKLTGKLTFTYSSSLPITSYRIHLSTDLGGSLTANGTADCYVAANVGDIEAGKLPAWTRTVNADGTYTVTFDLSSLAYFANGTELRGLTIVTVTANKITGTITYKSIELEKDLDGHDCQAEGHFMKEATCTQPKTCYVCGATEGEADVHSWEDATCTQPKTCSYCRAKEGTVISHRWKAATCQTPRTCSVCGTKSGTVADHSYVEDFCSVCGIPEVIRTKWDMSNKKAAADWSGYHAKKKNEALTKTVTVDGTAYEYQAPGNGWKGIVLEKTSIETSRLTGKLIFTYSSDMAITSYRIHILTNLGGKLTVNGTADCYTAASVADITAGNLAAWTQTTNEDGSVTVTFDLATMKYFARGTELQGLTIVTVTKNNTIGTVTYESVELELDLEGYDCQTDGHIMQEATCTEPEICLACGATEGEPAGHDWIEATCTQPKTCSACTATEGEVSDHVDTDEDHKCDNCGANYCVTHTWVDATCATPKTCSVCGAAEGDRLAHKDADMNYVCDACVSSMVIWYMNEGQDADDWTGYHSKKKDEALTATVTEVGLAVNYQKPGNGWKGLVLEDTAIKISKLTGKLAFTYSSDMAVTSYRIHVLTDLGGDLTVNGTADCYTSVSIANIKAGKLPAWTQTTNADGSVTVTFDLSTMGYFANGTELKGLTIVTVTANGVTGTVTYKSIELESKAVKHDCQLDGHIWMDATCAAPKTCAVCGAAEGETTDHTWLDATCTAPRTCDVCGVTEGEPLDHIWLDATCTAPKTCDVCGVTEGDPSGHSFVQGVCSACGARELIRNQWNMSKEEDAAEWVGYHAKKENEALTATVTEDGLNVAYASPGNGWKGLVLKDTAIKISDLSGKLTFTYSTDMTITNYRIHILTDLGGNLTANGTADCYTAASIANITAGKLDAWTQTVNADGSITVTFDLSTMGYFADGAELRGLTIVTVTANNTTGTVTYKTIALENRSEAHDCQVDGHIWLDATCTEPKICDVCGAAEGEPAGHAWMENVCLKTCSACGITEGTSVAHSFENGCCSVCGTKQWDTDSDGVLEILALGNSFSVDALEYAWQIANDMGIEKIVIGNLYIGSCSLNTHITNANTDGPSYRFYYCDEGTWSYTSDYKLSAALESRSWDYVSIQQASGQSGVESTYNEDLTDLIAYIKERSNAKLVWHMTWAYQQDCTHSAFPTYNSDQMTMYNAIVSAVQNKVATNGDFALIVPNGTAIQNARTSLVGDTLTRDGYHMSKDYGRYLTGLMFVKTVTGLDISGIQYAPDGVSSQYREIAVESVNNAYAKPFEVTQSAYRSEDMSQGYILLQPKLYKGAYWNPTNKSSYNKLITDSSISSSFFATIRFTREDLPVGTVIKIASGWQYRPDGWVTDKVQTGVRETNTTESYVEITEQWWGDYTIRSFNISKTDQSSLAQMTEAEIRAVFQIYVPKESHNHKYEGGYCTLCGAVDPAEPGEGEGGEDTSAVWDMSDAQDAACWSGYHAKQKNEALTTAVTADGMAVTYQAPGNGWKGIVLENTAIKIDKLTGKLTFTYSSDMTITNYRIHILTDLGGNLTANGTADCYTAASVANITAGKLDAWTQTVNADGSITVTFDLSTMGYFANGAELKGLTIVTVTANKTPGTVTYKKIEIQ